MSSVLRALPRSVWILLGAVLVNRLGVMVMPFLSFYLRSQEYDPDFSVRACSLYACGAMLSAWPAGLLADRWGRRKLLVCSMGFSALLMPLLFHLHPLWMLLPGVFLVGLVAEAYRPAVTAMLTDLVPIKDRLPVFALHRVVNNLGHAIGPTLGGILAGAALYSWLFYLNGISSGCFALVALCFLPETRVRPREARKGWPLDALRDRALLRFCLGMLPISAGYFLLLTALPMHLHEHVRSADGTFPTLGLLRWMADWSLLPATVRESLATPQGTFGALMAANGLLIVLFEYRIALWLRPRDPRTVLVAGALATGLGLLAIGMLLTTSGALAGVVLVTVGEMLFMPTALYVLSRLAPPHGRAEYLALFGLTNGMALVLAPLCSGDLLEDLGPHMFWSLCALLAGSAALLFARLPRQLASGPSEPLDPREQAGASGPDAHSSQV